MASNNQRKLEIQLIRLEDIDKFSSEAPFVKFTSLADGSEAKSGETIPQKKSDHYAFTEENGSKLIFGILDGVDEYDYFVAVMGKDKPSGQTIQYPGIGSVTINIKTDPESQFDVLVPLYEDGDMNLEIGVLRCRYKLIVPATVDGGTAKEIANPTNSKPAKLPVIASAAANQGNNSTVADVDEVLSETESIIMPEDTTQNGEVVGNKNQQTPLTPKRPVTDPSKTNPLPTNNGRKIENKTNPVSTYTDQNNADTVDYNDDFDERIDSVPKPGRCSVAALARQDDTNLINAIKSDLNSCSKLLQKFTTRFHGCILRCNSPTDEAVLKSSTILRVSVMPIPQKKVVFRPSKVVDFSENNENIWEMSFGLKTAVLSMNEAEIRSKLFMNGQCPRLTVELCNSIEGEPFAVGELYLPTLLQVYSGTMLPLPLELKDTSKYSAATITFEINPTSGDTASVADRGVPVIPAQLSASRMVIQCFGAFSANKNKNKVVSKYLTSLTASSVVFNNAKVGQVLNLDSINGLVDIMRFTLYDKVGELLGVALVPTKFFLSNQQLSEPPTSYGLWSLNNDIKAPPTGIRMVSNVSAEGIDNSAMNILLPHTESEMNDRLRTQVPTADQQTSPQPAKESVIVSPMASKQDTNNLSTSASRMLNVKEAWGATSATQAGLDATAQRIEAPTISLQSQNGTLVCSVKGFLKALNESEAEVNPDLYSLDVTIFPNESKFSTSDCKVTPILDSMEFSGRLNWNLDIKNALTWTLAQVWLN